MIALVTYLTCVGLSVGQPVYCPVSGSSGEPPYTFTPDGFVPIQFVNILSDSETARALDNLCYTYFKSADNYVVYLSVVYRNGTNRIFSFLIQADCSTIFYAAPRCSFESQLFASGPGQTDLFYRTFISASCEDELSIEIFRVAGLTPRYGELPQCYLSELVNIIGQSGYGCENVISLPMSLPPKCITSQPCTVNATNCDSGLYQPGQSGCNSCGH